MPFHSSEYYLLFCSPQPRVHHPPALWNNQLFFVRSTPTLATVLATEKITARMLERRGGDDPRKMQGSDPGFLKPHSSINPPSILNQGSSIPNSTPWEGFNPQPKADVAFFFGRNLRRRQKYTGRAGESSGPGRDVQKAGPRNSGYCCWIKPVSNHRGFFFR